MTDLPKIVVERLRGGAQPQTHPDPELINAFAENTLSKRDRNEVLAHLARCNECRELLALSLPEPAGSALARPQPAGGAWLSWPVLRWGALAACIVVVGAAVTLRYESRSRSQQITAAPAPEMAKLDYKAGEPELRHNRTQTSKEISNQPIRETRNALSAPPAMGPKKAIPGKPTASATGDETGNLQEQSTAQPAPAAPNNAIVQLVPGRAKEAESTAFKDNLAAVAGPLARQNAATAALAVNKAMVPAPLRLIPRWTLTSDGTLQRSLDSGKTWETISVSSQANFRALAANGFDIWVGGSKGALFHSSDSGQHWTQVRPIANGEVLSADIIGVEFADSQHGTISTSAQETWTTDDAGQSWQREMKP